MERVIQSAGEAMEGEGEGSEEEVGSTNCLRVLVSRVGIVT